MLKSKLDSKCKGPEIIHVLSFGQAIIKFIKESRLGVGALPNIKKILRNCFRTLFLKFWPNKTHPLHISHLLLSMGSEIQGSIRAEMFTIGEFGQEALIFNHIKPLLGLLIVNLAHSPYQSGKPSSILPKIRMIEITRAK